MTNDRDLAHARPWLLASLFFGISFIFIEYVALPGILHILWKGAAVGFLVPYALRWRGVSGIVWIAAIMAFGSAGDMAIELDLVWGAFLFFCGHLIAITFYWRHRRDEPAPSQIVLSVAIPIFTLFLCVLLAPSPAVVPGLLVYGAGLGLMAGTAWLSRFPRYRTGIGALLFLASDLFIFAREGNMISPDITRYLVWPLYYTGQLLIAIGVVQTLRRSASSEA